MQATEEKTEDVGFLTGLDKFLSAKEKDTLQKLTAKSPEEKDSGWKLQGTVGATYAKVVTGKRWTLQLPEYTKFWTRSEMIFPNTSIDVIRPYLQEADELLKRDPEFDQVEVLKRDDNVGVKELYYVLKMPVLCSNR